MTWQEVNLLWLPSLPLFFPFSLSNRFIHDFARPHPRNRDGSKRDPPPPPSSSSSQVLPGNRRARAVGESPFCRPQPQNDEEIGTAGFGGGAALLTGQGRLLWAGAGRHGREGRRRGRGWALRGGSSSSSNNSFNSSSSSASTPSSSSSMRWAAPRLPSGRWSRAPAAAAPGDGGGCGGGAGRWRPGCWGPPSLCSPASGSLNPAGSRRRAGQGTR